MKTRIDALIALRNDKRIKGAIELQCIDRCIRDFKIASKKKWVWKENEVLKTIKFLKLLHHWKGVFAGESFVPTPWQEQCVIAPLFGWYNSDGTRRFREVYVEVCRKIGKTFLAGAVGLKCLLADNEQGAEVYSVANKKDQAMRVFDDAREMVMDLARKRPDVVRVPKRMIENPKTGGKFEALASDKDTLDGLNSSCVVIDEYHAAKTRKIYDVMSTSKGARENPILFVITTAGDSVNCPCYELREQALRVIDPKSKFEKDDTLIYIACADETDDWTKESTWQKGNPNWFEFKTLRDEIRNAYEKAKQQPSFVNTFKRYHCGIWCNSRTRWIDIEKWDQCPPAAPSESLRKRPAYMAIDLSSKIDLTALSICVPLDDGTWQLETKVFIPIEELEERELRDRVPYRLWIGAGLVTTTGGSTIDQSAIRREINRIAKEDYEIKKIAVDPWHADDLMRGLIDDGFSEESIFKFPQDIKNISSPSKDFEKAIYDRKIRHGGNPVLRWNAECCSIYTDPNGNIKPVKPRREEYGKRIDTIITSIMAFDIATTFDSSQPVLMLIG